MACALSFRVKMCTQPGEIVCILGDVEPLGSWDVKKSHYLTTSEAMYPYWQSPESVEIKRHASVIFKAAVIRNGEIQRWEHFGTDPLENRCYSPATAKVMIEFSEGLKQELLEIFSHQTKTIKYGEIAEIDVLGKTKVRRTSGAPAGYWNPYRIAKECSDSDGGYDDQSDFLAWDDDEDTAEQAKFLVTEEQIMKLDGVIYGSSTDCVDGFDEILEEGDLVEAATSA
jgi:hypothetical protein